MTFSLRLPLLCVLLLLASPALAGDDGFGVIMGTVLSPEDRELLAGVEVVATSPVLMGERAVRTDENGFFWLPQLPPGPYTLAFYYDGLDIREETLTVRLNQTHLANVELPHRCMAVDTHEYPFPDSVPLGARRSRLNDSPFR